MAGKESLSKKEVLRRIGNEISSINSCVQLAIRLGINPNKVEAKKEETRDPFAIALFLLLIWDKKVNRDDEFDGQALFDILNVDEFSAVAKKYEQHLRPSHQGTQPVRSAKTERSHANGTDQAAAADGPVDETDGGRKMAEVRVHGSFEEFKKEPFVPSEHVTDMPDVEVGLCIIVSKNPREFEAVRYHLKEHPQHTKVLEYRDHHQKFPLTFYLGSMLGSDGNFYCTVLVSCEQGSFSTTSKAGSITVANRCKELWHPKFMTTVGVGFGTSDCIISGSVKMVKDASTNKELSLGDVLVSDTLVTDKERHGDNVKSRSEAVECFEGMGLLKTIADNYNGLKSRTDQFVVIQSAAGERKSKVFIGPLISSEKLIDNPKKHGEMAQLHSHTPKVLLGGEMEGMGILEICRGATPPIHFLVIKGISDWADSTKSKELQAAAAFEAMAFFLYALPAIATHCHIQPIPQTAALV